MAVSLWLSRGSKQVAVACERKSYCPRNGTPVEDNHALLDVYGGSEGESTSNRHLWTWNRPE